VPVELVRQAKEDPTVAQLVQRERALLRVNVEAVKERVRNLEKTRDLYQEQIDAVTHQIEASKTQRDSVQKEMGAVKTLLDSGLSPKSRQWNLERMEGQIQMTEQGYQSLILQTRENMTQIDQKILDLKNEHEATVNTQLQQNVMGLEEVSVKLGTSQRLMADALVRSNILRASSTSVVDSRRLTVTRTVNGKEVTIDADQSTELLPGDVLNVDVPAGPAPAGVSGMPGKRGALGLPAAYEGAMKQPAAPTDAAISKVTGGSGGLGVETVEQCERLMLQDQTPAELAQAQCRELFDVLRADVVVPAAPTSLLTLSGFQVQDKK
jgi:tetrahydromethanopterin S-methyltransferase subunit B